MPLADSVSVPVSVSDRVDFVGDRVDESDRVIVFVCVGNAEGECLVNVSDMSSDAENVGDCVFVPVAERSRVIDAVRVVERVLVVSSVNELDLLFQLVNECVFVREFVSVVVCVSVAVDDGKLVKVCVWLVVRVDKTVSELLKLLLTSGVGLFEREFSLENDTVSVSVIVKLSSSVLVSDCVIVSVNIYVGLSLSVPVGLFENDIESERSSV